MMLFLSSHNNVNIFDFLNESALVEQPFMLKKISSAQIDLSAFAKKEALSIGCYKYLAIDLSSVTNDTEALKTALQSIHMMNPKMKFMYVDIGSKNAELHAAGDVKVITADPDQEQSEFKAQVAEALNHATVFKDTEEKIQEAVHQKKDSENKSKNVYNFETKNVTVAVINAYPRAGATTLSINIVQYLGSIGAAAAYVECNGGIDHLEQIRNNTPGFTTINQNTFRRGEVLYRKGETPDENMDFIVCDMGAIIQDNTENSALHYVLECNVIILCGTSKPYELEEIHQKIEILQNYGCKICLCLSFTPERERAQLIDTFGSKNVSVYFINYTPDMFEAHENEDVYGRILQDYIQEKANDNMLKIF